MQGNRENVPHVPWSRHMVVSPKTAHAHVKNYIERPIKGPLKKKHDTQGGISTSSLDNSRRVKSESSVLCKPEVDEIDSWDSQSDPGSISSKNFKGFLSGHQIPASLEGDCGGGRSLEIIKRNGRMLKPTVHARGGHQQIVRNRKRKRTRSSQHGLQENEEFIVTIPDEDPTVNATRTSPMPRYINIYYDVMYYTCVNPHKWNTREEKDQTNCMYFLGVIQKIIFCYISIMATFGSLNLIKFFILNFLVDRSLNNFIDIGYFIVSGVFQMYIVYLIAFEKEQIQKTRQVWESYEIVMNGLTNEQDRIRTPLLPIFNGIVTVIMAGLKSMKSIDSLNDVIWINSIDAVDGLFLWTTEGFENIESIHESYLDDVNSFTIIMALFGTISTFCWHLLADSFKDLLFWLAKVNEHHVSGFANLISANFSMKMAEEQNSEENDDKCWRLYRNLKEINTSTNSTYYILLIINHVDTFLTFSYFLTLVLEKSSEPLLLITTGYDVLKGILPYIPARRTSLQNEICRKWIQTLPCKTERFRAAGAPLTREVMLSELKEEPLGLGNGKVHINNEFLVSFITLVASLFCFLLNLKPKEGQPKKY